MKVTHVSTQDTGGAGSACVRLSDALKRTGVDSSVLALYAASSLPGVLPYRPTLIERAHDLFIRYRHRQELLPDRDRSETFSFPDTGFRIGRHSSIRNADIVNLHWVAQFLDYGSFFAKRKKGIVWTLHDMGPFANGNHYTQGAHATPETEERIEAIKRRVFADPKLEMTVVSPSQWLLDVSKRSTAFGRFPHVRIPNGLDSNVYRPYDRDEARRELGIKGEKVVLFVAESLGSKRKGFSYLEAALPRLEQDGVTLCMVGNAPAHLSSLPHTRSFGYVRDETLLSKIYSAADVFVIPSLEDNLPNTMLESLMCGTPVVGFRVGGIGETISPRVNGLLCDTIDADALAETIREALRTDFDCSAIRNDAVARFDLAIAAQAYADLYRSILSKRS